MRVVDDVGVDDFDNHLLADSDRDLITVDRLHEIACVVEDHELELSLCVDGSAICDEHDPEWSV